MPTVAELHAIAQQIKTAQDQGLRLTQITAQHAGFDTGAAYAVADLVHAMRLAEGAQAVGRKIGFTNPAMWAQYGVSAPVWGHVYNTTLAFLPETSDTPAACSLRGFAQPKIEPEIIFHFHSAPPPHGDMAAVLA